MISRWNVGAAARYERFSSFGGTLDGKLSAQFEHTVAVTTTGFDVLTLRPEERNPRR